MSPVRVTTPRQVALRSLAGLGEVESLSVHFGPGLGVLIAVHDQDVTFMSRLLDLAELSVSDASDPRPVRDREVVVFQRTPHAHLLDGLSIEWFCDDGTAALAELADYRAVIEQDLDQAEGRLS